MMYSASHTASDQSDDAFDPSQIFIGREQQLDLFQFYLSRWQERIAGAPSGDTEAPALIAPSPDNKIQGLVVLIYGRGGIGKSTLLRRFREKALQAGDAPRASKVTTSSVIDWESASEGRRGLFAAMPGKGLDAAGYFRLLSTRLAIALGKNLDDFKHYRRAGRDVEEARKQAEHVIETLSGDKRYAGMRWVAGEGLIALLREIPLVRGLLQSEQIEEKVKELLGEGAAITAQLVEQLVRLHTQLSDKLGAKFTDYLEPDLKLGLNLGYDLRDLARNYPLLIFFDTYETIDEGDRLLRIVMGAAGQRVGWVIAGRDNLWAGIDQRLRSLGIEYGYKEIVLPDRGLDIDFSKSNTGAFTRTDIKTYFDELCRRVPYDPPLAQITEEQAADIEKVTWGIPLAVSIASEIYLKTGNMIAITERERDQRDFVDRMVRRYLLHVRDDESDRPKLYGLALLRRANQPHVVATALQLSLDEAKTRYGEELARLQRRYSFIFTEVEQPELHDEVRYFLRLWLLEHRAQPDIIVINERLKAAYVQALQQLEERGRYSSLRERLEEDEWVGIYLDLVEQQFWLDPAEGVRYGLPFMFAAAVYRRDASSVAAKIGEFFRANLKQPFSNWWNWAIQSLIYSTSRNPSDEQLAGLEELKRLASRRCPAFFQPLPDYQKELEAALWWRLGEAYQGKDDKKALEWYEKALTRLGQQTDLREAAAETYYALDGKLFEEKKHAERIPLLDRAVELKPDFVSAYNSRGLAYESQSKYEQAIADYDRIIELDLKYAVVYGNRGLAYYYLTKYEQAIADYDRAIELDPKGAVYYANRGNAYANLTKYERAIADYSRAIELDPKNAVYYANRADVYHNNFKEYQHAIADYDRAIELDPKNAVYYANRGNSYNLLQEYQRTIADYDRAIELDPKNAVYYANRGNAYANLTKYERAIADYDRAIELDPKLAWAYNSRGIVYRNLKQYERAIDDYDRAIELDPKDGWAYNNRGFAYRYLHEHEREIADYDRAIDLDPQNATAYGNRGFAYYCLKEHQRAIADYDRAIDLDPQNANNYNNRGNAFASLSKHEQAIADYDHAIELDSNFDWPYNNRGLAYLHLKDIKQARADFTYSWELSQTNLDALWTNEWAGMDKKRVRIEIAEKLETIASVDPLHYVAHCSRGVALGLRSKLNDGLVELEKAILLKPEEPDAYFWKGMIYAYMGRNLAAMAAIEKALELDLPPILITPLYWLENDRLGFFEQYAKPVLEKYGV